MSTLHDHWPPTPRAAFKPMDRRCPLVVYSAAFRPFCVSLIDSFEQAYPHIALNFVDGVSTGLHQRYLQAHSRSEAVPDVIWSSAMDLQLTLAQSGHARAHTSDHTQGLPGWARFSNVAFATTLEPLVSVYHRDHVAAGQSVSTLGEVADWLALRSGSGQPGVGCFDIAQNGMGFLAMFMAQQDASQFARFAAQLRRHKPQLFAANPPMVDALASGQVAVGLHMLGAFAARAVRAHAPLAVCAGPSKRLGVSRVALITAQAAHPTEAALFVDHLLSPLGQTAMARDGLFPLLQAQPAMGLPNVEVEPLPIDGGMADVLNPVAREALWAAWRRAALA